MAAVSARAAIVTGGGTGGHVFPGLAIADELSRRGWMVSWAGTGKGLEARLVPERGVDFHALPARPMLGQGLAGKARAGAALAAGAVAGWRLVRRLGAQVVVGTGGYASAPAVLGGRLAARPVLLFEPNAEAGSANRWLSRVATEAAVAWESAAEHLRCPARTTGVPVRAAFFAVEEAPSPPPLRLLVVGGSQGAQQLNELVPAALARIAERHDVPELAVVHQAGGTKVEATREAYRSALGERGARIAIEVVPFLDDMPAAMGGAHLVVSRAGAITLAEICAAGRAALLVPLAAAAGHQVDNARRLAAAGAARLFVPNDVPNSIATTFAELLAELAADPGGLVALGRAARQLARADAAAAIADRVERITPGGPS